MMLKINTQLIILLCFCQIGFAQESKSIHQLELEAHAGDTISFHKSNTTLPTIPLNKQAFEQKALSHYVFGYLPYWVHNSPPIYFKFDLLTHIALFNFTINSATGAIGNPPNWPWAQLIDVSHTNGVKVIMVVTEFDNDKIHTIIANPTVKNNFFEKIKDKIETYKLDGINIDFEGLHTTDRSTYINIFMNELTDFVHANIGADKEVSIAAPAVNWGGWNFTALAAACDYLFIMGYDFWGRWSSTAGPSSPLIGGIINITNTLTNSSNGYGAVVNSTPEKLILGVPYYGNNWRTATQAEGSSALDYIGSRTYSKAKMELGSGELKWSTKYKTPWYTFENSGQNYQTWFDNDSSLGLKYDLAKSKNIKGVGMWALGYDEHHPELWDLLRTKFYTEDLDTTNGTGNPDKFILHQNYPNPFNPSTTIEYEIIVAGNIELNIYDIIGEKVAVLVDEYQPVGKYSESINVKTLHATSLPSGTYIYQIKTDSHSEMKKMLLIK